MPLISNLSRWDDPRWHAKPNYSAAAALTLKAGHIALATAPQERASYLRVFNALSHLLHLSLCDHQREHLVFLLGMCSAADSRYQLARSFLDEALDLAILLDELGDACEIRALRASVYRALSKFGEAATDLRTCLSTWSEHAQRSGETLSQVVNPNQRLQVLSQLAGYDFFIADYQGAQETIDQGRALLPLLDEHSHYEATFHWAQAHLYRASHHQQLALDSILAAHEAYQGTASPLTQIRLDCLTAETALDLAETLPIGTHRHRIIMSQAAPYLNSAESLIRRVGDDPGLGLTILDRTRESRLLGRDEIRDLRIESVIHLARHIKDEVVLAQAHSTLGDEFAAQGQFSKALGAYRDTLNVLDGSEAVALKMPARLMIQRIEARGDR